MLREEGPAALYRGMGFRLCYVMPFAAVQVGSLYVKQYDMI
jgi:hypothetical protein